MKKALLFVVAVLWLCFAKGQGGTWVWVNGTDSVNATGGVYGTQGLPAANNTPQGLYEAACWTDLQGNFWLFGGVTVSQQFQPVASDLWKYDPVANMWSWVKGAGLLNEAAVPGTQGVPSAANTPGGRGWGSATWTDNNGDLWLFGGAMGENDNDLWRYNIASNEWTWMTGTVSPNVVPPGNYGRMGVPAATNVPGGRSECNSAWADSSNQLWFFGGYDGTEPEGFNDVWRYNISDNLWTWMKGDTVVGGLGNYGILGQEASSNLPPCRGSYTRWKDEAGNFYVWGGWLYAGRI